ncbi:hypothetical protein HMPREF9332_01405 [Alloprevotella rava F0323]|uniref:Glycosyl transferase family 1 domain-containing protein n=1 Tax=Alloprevotella rava F0323 TaxID=679199 RepID=G5GCV4_9BACT|nr:hypothetical protein [Alloprevotella rava]EHG22600.1 hypothetical protein HMPREF9332_01405 [Alloprevotella rava F0323]
MKIIFLFKSRTLNSPSLSTLLMLKELGHELAVISEGLDEYWVKELGNKQIRLHILNTQSKSNNPISKFISYKAFQKKAMKAIKEEFRKDREGTLWISGAQTILALGDKIKDYHYILQIHELHEHFNYQLKAIRKVIHSADLVFMPEYNRSIIYQVWFKLDKRPIVLPNKPYFLPTIKELEKFKNKHKELVSFFLENKVVLYQGEISAERDLSAFAQACYELPEYKFILLGKDHGMLNKYKQINSNLVHIDYTPAPEYLLFTSLAHIGIVTYDPKELNTAYCAPNKIFEYSAFKKPMLGNNIPGLKVLEYFKAGVIVDEQDKESIKKGIKMIEENYTIYQKGTDVLFNSVDNREIIRKALESIKKH